MLFISIKGFKSLFALYIALLCNKHVYTAAAIISHRCVLTKLYFLLQLQIFACIFCFSVLFCFFSTSPNLFLLHRFLLVEQGKFPCLVCIKYFILLKWYNMGEQRPPIRFKAPIPRVTGDITTRAADRINQLNNAMTIHVEGSQRPRSSQHGDNK